MTDTPNNPAPGKISQPSITVILAVALATSLAFSGHLILSPDVRAVAFSSEIARGVSVTQAPLANETQSVLINAPTPIPTDFNTVISQLQEMQNQMLTASAQLEQKVQAVGTNTAPMAGEDVAVLWAEIEQLNQQMQPLMAQLEAASANRSSRPASEGYALRTKINTIHMRLADLTARVQAAQVRANSGNGMAAGYGTVVNGSMNTTSSPNQATYEQLYRNMEELQHMLHQLQGNQQHTP